MKPVKSMALVATALMTIAASVAAALQSLDVIGAKVLHEDPLRHPVRAGRGSHDSHRDPLAPRALSAPVL